jgi:PAS domain S-box-containing protein
MRNHTKNDFLIQGGLLLLAALIVGILVGVLQYRHLRAGGGLDLLLLGGFGLAMGLLGWRLHRLVSRVTRDVDAVIETVERIGRGELACSLATGGKGSMHRLCEAINQMALDLQQSTAPREQLRQEIDDRQAAETALADSQRLWEKTFNAVPDLVAILDEDHHILKMNAAMAETLDRRQGSRQKEACYTLMHDNETTLEDCPHKRMLATGEEQIIEYLEPKMKRWLQVRVSPLRDAEGTIMGGVHIARDIHAHKVLEKKLAQRNTELQESVTALETANQRIVEQQHQLIKEERLKALLQMAGATAHEMNQPLMALQGNIELLQHTDCVPERKATHLRRISEAGGRLADIVRKIQTLRHDEVRPYPGGLTILDLNKADGEADDREAI